MLAATTSDITQDLAAQARGGDTAAFQSLYRETVDRVYAVCLRMACDEGRATELTQDVYVSAWKALPEYRGQSTVTTWLHRIAVNAFLSDERKEKTRRTRFTPLDDHDRPVYDPERETVLDLERAIQELPERARVVFVLHDVEGYRHNEIAEMTGMASGTSRAQLHRARPLLRDALTPEDHNDE